MTEESTTHLPGERLAKAREEAGQSVEQVANRLHLSNSYVKALEADDYERLPEPLFIKGYIRSYAQLFDLPVAELTGQFEQLIAAQKSGKAGGKREDGSASSPLGASSWSQDALVKWGVAVVAILLILALVMSVGEEDREALRDTETGADAEMMDEAGQNASAETGTGVAPEQLVDSVQTDQLADEPVLTAGQSGSGEDVEEPVQPSDSALKSLQFSFTGDCWLEVKDADGQSLFTGLRQQGNDLSLRGKAPFRIKLGDVSVVALSIDGEAVSLSGYPSGQPVRLTLPR